MGPLLLQIVLSNALAAAALGLLVWCVGLAVKRPAVMRALWVVVLIKLLTPPIWTLPVHLPTHAVTHRAVDAYPIAETQTDLSDGVSESLPSATVEVATAPVTAPPPPRTNWVALAVRCMIGVWIAGSILLIARTSVRLLFLRRLLRAATFAPRDIQSQATQLARHMGITHTPGVWFVHGPVCPALWAFSRQPKLLIPFELWSDLDDCQRQTLLAHELAHLHRRDHWVRLIETVCVLIWWWHPVVWWACRRIHDFEEQCCDAWVLWAMPTSARSYGDALLATVEFVSTYRPAVPALSAGLGEFHHLKRRLLMIRQGQAKRALSRTGLLAVGATALAALSVGPALGQSAETVPAPEKLGTSAAPVSPTPSASIESDDATVASLKELDRAKMQVDHLQRQLADLQRKLDIATARLKVLEQGGSMGAGLESGTGRGGVSSGRPGAAYGITSRFAPPGVYPGANSTMPVPSGGIAAFDPNQPGNVSANSRSGTMTFAPNRAAGNSFRKPDRQADRLDAMQKQLQQMMQDLQKMRDEQADRPGASADAAPEAPAKR